MRYLALLLMLCAPLAMAQAEKPRVRLATEADFTGYWRLVMIPDEVHKSKYKNESTGYAGACQFFLHKPGGAWFNVSFDDPAGAEASRRKCPTKRGEIDARSAAQPPRAYQWSKAPKQEGLFFVRDTTVTDPKAPGALLWKVDYVLRDVPATPAFNFRFRKGDLIMQVTRRMEGNNITAVWPMVLRPVPD